MSVACHYCKHQLTKAGQYRLTWDHKIPKSRGGKNTESNLVPACFQCNQEKGILTEEEFRVVLAFRKAKTKPERPMVPVYVLEDEPDGGLTFEDHKFLYQIGVSCE